MSKSEQAVALGLLAFWVTGVPLWGILVWVALKP